MSISIFLLMITIIIIIIIIIIITIFSLMKMTNYVYDRQFRENLLSVGGTGFGNTYFMQKLAINNFFGDLLKAEWVSYIHLIKRERLKFSFVLVVILSFII